jgi:hypothetical protein
VWRCEPSLEVNEAIERVAERSFRCDELLNNLAEFVGFLSFFVIALRQRLLSPAGSVGRSVGRSAAMVVAVMVVVVMVVVVMV